MLCQLQTVRSRLGLTELEVQWDALLDNAIAAVSARFDLECNRTFARTVNIAQEFCAGDRNVVLRCHPVESVTRFDLKSNEAGGWIEQTGVNYLLKHRCVLVLEGPPGVDAQQARVTYTGGYLLPGAETIPGGTALPPDLEQAAVEQVCWWFSNRERLGLSRIWEYHGTYRDFGDLDLLSSTRAVLTRYARLAG